MSNSITVDRKIFPEGTFYLVLDQSCDAAATIDDNQQIYWFDGIAEWHLDNWSKIDTTDIDFLTDFKDCLFEDKKKAEAIKNFIEEFDSDREIIVFCIELTVSSVIKYTLTVK